MHRFFGSSVWGSFGIAIESLNLSGCNSDILSMSSLKPSVTFKPVCTWRVGNSQIYFLLKANTSMCLYVRTHMMHVSMYIYTVCMYGVRMDI